MEIENKKDLILECSKLLAEYLNYEYLPFVQGSNNLVGWWRKDRPNILTKNVDSYFLARTHKDLRFFNDWNLLMRVWIKYLNSGIEIQDTEYLMWNTLDKAQTSLLEANREQFFYSLVDVVKYLNKDGKAS